MSACVCVGDTIQSVKRGTGPGAIFSRGNLYIRLLDWFRVFFLRGGGGAEVDAVWRAEVAALLIRAGLKRRESSNRIISCSATFFSKPVFFFFLKKNREEVEEGEKYMVSG